jgi:flagellar basal body rod protein FlgG
MGSEKGRLADSSGRLVLGTGGPIQKRAEGGTFTIEPNGTIAMGGEPIGQLKIVTFSSEAVLRKTGRRPYGTDPRRSQGR